MYKNIFKSTDDVHEECGVFGIYGKSGINCAEIVYHALYALQHRGQESCGIAVNNDNIITCHKELGLVGEVFDRELLNRMEGNIAVGHVRYSTTGSNTRENAQPLTSRYVKGSLTVVHNGNISNAPELRQMLEETGAIFHSTNDTEIIALLIARERLKVPSVEKAVSNTMKLLKGSFSLLVMSPRKLIAARDPYGIRPLCMGRIDNSYVFSSESCALDCIGAVFDRDIEPGEIVCIDPQNIYSLKENCINKSALCIFEHIYFARPDSVIDGQSVYESRLLAGEILAQTSPTRGDMVIGVPDSGIIAAMGYSRYSGIPFGEGLVKNRYVGRTFIQPKQSQREKSVSVKLNTLKHNVEGKRIIMIDDSIVRGTTISRLIKMLKTAGASEVHIKISSPKFLYPCFFGTDIPDRDQLVCNKYSTDELCGLIGADSLTFFPLERLKDIIPNFKKGFCDACFSGNYPFEVPISANKNKFE